MGIEYAGGGGISKTQHAGIGHTSPMITNGEIVNADLNAAAAIAYGKLDLATSITDADWDTTSPLAWSNLSKTGSDLADLAARSHASLTSITASDHHVKTANVPGWNLLDSYSDTATTTAADFDTGVLGTIYNIYKVVFQFQQQAGTMTNVNCRVNADSTANYNYTEEASGALATASGATEWRVGQLQHVTAGEAILRGGNMAASASTANDPSIGATVANSYDCTILLHGRLNAGYADVDQIKIYTNQNATGRAKVYGINL